MYKKDIPLTNSFDVVTTLSDVVKSQNATLNKRNGTTAPFQLEMFMVVMKCIYDILKNLLYIIGFFFIVIAFLRVVTKMCI